MNFDLFLTVLTILWSHRCSWALVLILVPLDVDQSEALRALILDDPWLLNLMTVMPRFIMSQRDSMRSMSFYYWSI